ncbi:MAG: type VI secretion system ATPase TssH, partial [Anaerolineae bacterium]|nr:type VI secretion system ATPase TssH [Anaerolineae bacterium]
MAFDFDKYTNKAQEAILKAQTLAAERGHTAIEPLHLVVALIQQKDGVVPETIAKIGARVPQVIAEFEQMLNERPRSYGSNMKPNLGRAGVEALNRAEAEASTMKDDYISTEHILLGLTDDTSLRSILEKHGINHDAIL